MKLERALGILAIRALSCPNLDSLNDQMSEIAKTDDHLWQQMMFCVAKVNPSETMGLTERETLSRELNERAESLRAQSNVSSAETLKKLASCAALLCHEETYRELSPGAGVTLEVLSNIVPSHLFAEAQEHLAQELSSVAFLKSESMSC